MAAGRRRRRPPAPPPPPAESTYLLAEFVAGDSNNQSVRVWDPAQPAVAIQNVQLVQSNGIVWTSSHLVFSDATHYDAATRSVTTLGHAKVFYDNDGKLYSIDLRGGQSHAPVQLSSAVDVFLPAQRHADERRAATTPGSTRRAAATTGPSARR